MQLQQKLECYGLAIYPLTHLDHTWTDLTAAQLYLMNIRIYISWFLLFIFDIWSESMIPGAAETIYHDGAAICAAHKAHLCACSPHHLNSSTWEVPEGLLASCFGFLLGIQWPHRSEGYGCLLENLMYECVQHRCTYVLFNQINAHECVGSQGMHRFANIFLEFACINAHYTAGKLCSLICFDLVPWSINLHRRHWSWC